MRHVSLFALIVTLAGTSSLTACGGGTRHLQAISVSPATATGSAQFTATGMFNQAPSQVTLTTPNVGWCGGVLNGNCQGEAINQTIIANVDQNGTATCLPGAQGTTKIRAFDPNSFPTPRVSGEQSTLFGEATLICP